MLYLIDLEGGAIDALERGDVRPARVALGTALSVFRGWFMRYGRDDSVTDECWDLKGAMCDCSAEEFVGVVEWFACLVTRARVVVRRRRDCISFEEFE